MQDVRSKFQKAARQAAMPIEPGMSIKSQLNRACDHLGYRRGHWRVRDAWYGYADNWGVKDAFDFIERFRRYRQRAGSRLGPIEDPFEDLFETEES